MTEAPTEPIATAIRSALTGAGPGAAGARAASRRLWMRYALALGLIVVLLVGVHMVHIVSAHRSEGDAEMINVTAGQRMLSQRMLYAASRYTETGNPVYASVLEDARDSFLSGHDRILANALNHPGLQERYLGTGANLDRHTLAFARMADEILAHRPGDPGGADLLGAMEGLGLNEFLAELDDAVIAVEAHARQNQLRARDLQAASLAATLCVIALEVLFIFVPATRYMQRSLRELDRQASNDPLTGLANRKRLAEVLDAMVAADRTGGAGLAALTIDLDGFKAINDALGHPVGDQVLVHLADLLVRTLDTMPFARNGLVARLGGDEFVIVAVLDPGRAVGQIEALGARLLEAALEPIPVALPEKREDCVIGLSMGYAFASESDGNADTLLANSDIALYVSKRRGKGRITRFTAGMRDEAERRHRIATDLRRALLQSEFVPVYQPQVAFGSGKLEGFEVLARWNHPRKGVLAPDQFLDAADEAQLLDAVEAAVIFRALEEIGRLREADFAIPTFSINASAGLLRDPDFVDDFLCVCEMHGVSPAQITVEILETVLIEGADDQAARSIVRLARQGFGTAIDDFGTGYASLSAVSELEIGAIKIDRKLIGRCSEEKSAKVLSATIAMGRSMGLTIVAEGIENDIQFQTMRRLGADIAQGTLVGEAMDVERVKTWFEERRSGPRAIGAT